MGAQRFRASSLFLAVSHAAANTTRSLRRGTERDAERRGVQESTHVFFFPLEQKQRDRGGSEVRMKVRQAVCVCEREFFFSLFSLRRPEGKRAFGISKSCFFYLQ
jgi:hypothetical protein